MGETDGRAEEGNLKRMCYRVDFIKIKLNPRTFLKKEREYWECVCVSPYSMDRIRVTVTEEGRKAIINQCLPYVFTIPLPWLYNIVI